MSIIQEALKKVQKDVERKIPSREKPVEVISSEALTGLEATSIPSVTARAGFAFPRYAPYALAALIVFCVAGAYTLIRPGVTSNLPVSPASLAEDVVKEPSASQDPTGSDTKPQTRPAANKAKFAPIELIKDVVAIPFGGRLGRNNSALVLNGIMYLDEGSRAIINNSIVVEGDNIEGAVVKKIYRKSVVLSSGGSEFRLDLK